MTSTALSPALSDGKLAADIALAVAAGRTLIAAGAIFALANATQWAIMSGVVRVSPAMLSLVWPLAVGLFLYVLRQLLRQGGDAARRTAVWSRIAILGQVGAALAFAGVSAATGHWTLMMWMSVVGLAQYGIAWSIAAVRTRTVWIVGVALGCFCAAGGVALLVGTPAQYLAYACGLVVFVLVPGLVLALRGRI